MNTLLRKATIQDMDTLYHWRNDETSRKASLNSDYIPYETHKKWYQDALNNQDIQIFIMESDSTPLGQVRLNYWYDELVISYSISPQFRGRHLGQEMLQLTEELLNHDPDARKDGRYLIAYVKKDNLASQHIFEKLKYKKEEQDKWFKYIKKIT